MIYKGLSKNGLHLYSHNIMASMFPNPIITNTVILIPLISLISNFSANSANILTNVDNIFPACC
jgi:hypothetical protein